jgi:integrase
LKEAGAPSVSSTSMTLKRALTRWLVVQRIGKRKSTQRYYREIVKMIRKAWRPSLAIRVEEISEKEVLRFAYVAGHYSAPRWNGMLSCLHATVPASLILKRRKVEETPRRMPTQMEFVRLLDECDRFKRTQAALVINFLAHTGMRITEARLLKWSDIYADRIEAPAETAKNGKPRSIPLVNGIAEVLDALRRLTGESGFVLPRQCIRRGLREACVRAGLPTLTHHDFRHLFATRCIESGVDLPTVARWLGHQDRGALLSRRYFHLLDDHSRNMAAKVRI